MKINILTLFPEMFSPLHESMIGRAIDNGIIEIKTIDIREYTEDKRRKVDDTPFGGGAGMVMQVQPIIDAFRQNDIKGRTIYMSPRGRLLTGELAEELSREDEISILCGHYEGVDQRALDAIGAEEVSIGDYVLTGGELPAMVMIEALARFIDGVLGGETSMDEESIYSGLLEYPQYSKPRETEQGVVPEILLSGNHKEIALWRWKESLRLTAERRPDLLEKYMEERLSEDAPKLSKGEVKVLEELGLLPEGYDRNRRGKR